jgi:hypothetical protein
MKYLLSFLVEGGGMEDVSPDEMKDGIRRWSAFDDEATERGALIACEPLESSSARASARRRRAARHRWAVCGVEGAARRLLPAGVRGPRRGARARKVALRSGSIEVRPVMDLSQFGYENRTVSPARATA